ncbi:hypothetical protein K7X08_028991 [Anisodus acutangulus]|uniref:Uncharacterized protein n=1 Tax=Anisodus acutangulus TaxID=402998 RepID=A0A9Q1L3G4_9SOLA|nr:hypothetical protein K7X08_028991 [Anisodus acutangulus]
MMEKEERKQMRYKIKLNLQLIKVQVLKMMQASQRKGTRKKNKWQHQSGRNEHDWKRKKTQPLQSNQYAALQNIEEEVVDFTKTSNTKEVADDARVVGYGESNHVDTANKEGKNTDKHNESQGVKIMEKESAKQWIEASFETAEENDITSNDTNGGVEVESTSREYIVIDTDDPIIDKVLEGVDDKKEEGTRPLDIENVDENLVVEDSMSNYSSPNK